MKLPLDILKASVEDRLTAIEQLWDSIDFSKDSITIPLEQQQLAKERLRNIESGETATISIEQLKKTIQNKYGL